MKVLLACAIVLFAISGCMSLHTRVGRRPDTAVLDKTLRIGESTRSNVVDALGEPYGKGMEMLPLEGKPRVMWTYYYEEGTYEEGKMDAHRIFLFVFFDQDKYDGYMWFSSLP